jgi:hypothetical protein
VADEVIGDYPREAEAAWQHMGQNYMIDHPAVVPIVTMATNDNWMEYTSAKWWTIRNAGPQNTGSSTVLWMNLTALRN